MPSQQQSNNTLSGQPQCSMPALLYAAIITLQVKPEMLSALKLGPGVMAPSRTNGFLNMLETMRKRTVMLTEQLPRFPSLSITASEIIPQGTFAEAQAQYLAPNADEVDALVKVKSYAACIHFHVALEDLQQIGVNRCTSSTAGISTFICWQWQQRFLYLFSLCCNESHSACKCSSATYVA